MSNPSASLGRQFPWSRVFPELGTRLKAEHLPQIVQCLACHQRRPHIVADDVLGGQWAHCTECDFSSDMIELAARVLGLDIPASITEIQSVCSIQGRLDAGQFQRYLDDHIGYRNRLNSFWGNARAELARGGSPSSRIRLRNFGGADQVRFGWLGRRYARCLSRDRLATWSVAPYVDMMADRARQTMASPRRHRSC
jgi:hypothetical protein